MANYTQAEREQRWATCIQYLNLAGTMPAAKKLALKDGYSYPTSVWITALSKMIGKQVSR